MSSSHPELPERLHDSCGIPNSSEVARDSGGVDRWNGNKRNAGTEASSHDEEFRFELVPIARGSDLGDEIRSYRSETALRVGNLPTNTTCHGRGRQAVR